MQEWAKSLHVSVRTVMRDWSQARAWLTPEARKTGGDDD
jgi:hypothetical protein